MTARGEHENREISSPRSREPRARPGPIDKMDPRKHVLLQQTRSLSRLSGRRPGRVPAGHDVHSRDADPETRHAREHRAYAPSAERSQCMPTSPTGARFGDPADRNNLGQPSAPPDVVADRTRDPANTRADATRSASKTAPTAQRAKDDGDERVQSVPRDVAI